MKIRITILLLIATLSLPSIAQPPNSQEPVATAIFTSPDRRPSLSLDGDWASIIDPYFSGLFSFHHQEKPNGWFLNRKPQPGDPFPTEYDYSKAPKLKVPGDWNTQRESLLFYEN